MDTPVILTISAIGYSRFQVQKKKKNIIIMAAAKSYMI